MTSINYLGSIDLGKIQFYEAKKATTITPVTFPGQNEGAVEGVDTLGVISYINIEGRMVGNFETIQGQCYDIRAIADGEQISTIRFISPFVNTTKGLKDSITRHQGSMGVNTDTSANELRASAANFQTYGVDTNDKVKNLVTGAVANVASIDSETQLTLKDVGTGLPIDIFPVLDGTGISFAVTANVNVKILSFNYKFEPPALSYCSYTLSLMVVK